eukprot:CAMPEP_0170603380 /NCGR_PEP_ID=MMETSP0224-20130122/18883_1 /TAXON_ID=285029 /ORGANISM="Togula jolla, Strain CCCM 725" /LENGTH=794 /DNA_ID=CAMNT_0010928261 /DNA_START=49 /DNA_END=2433 /DNA_ORIENTATION=-
MGCNLSRGAVATKEQAGNRGPSPSQSQNVTNIQQYGKLLDDYKLGKVLGQGAFGIVYLAHAKSSQAQFAVKMIDKVETPLAEIQEEISMLRDMEHENIVKLHNVYFEKTFVCLVMDLYQGGDLIEGMQKHWKTLGMINPNRIAGMVRQMLAGIAHIHFKGAVHRDVKGDNYLTNHNDISKPDTKVYLSDFGTVKYIREGERFKEKCGTQIYWSPEFFNKSYAKPVDVWALGVISFGLLEGKFPFRGENDVRMKDLRKHNFPKRCPGAMSKFILGLLDKDESSRLTAKGALKDPWLSSTGITPTAPDEVNETAKDIEGVTKDRANKGVDLRRRELVERLEQAEHGLQLETSWDQICQDSFEVADRDGAKKKYHWVDPARLDDEWKAASQVQDSDDLQSSSGENVIKQMLTEHGIDYTKWQDRLPTFVREIQTGTARLMLDASKHKNMVRVVNVVLLRICHGSGSEKKYLVKMKERLFQGRNLKSGMNLIPGTKKRPYENTVRVAERLLAERLQMTRCEIRWRGLLSMKEDFEEAEDSPNYPGVRTVYHKHILEGAVTTKNAEELARVCLTTGEEFMCTDSQKNERWYRWCTETECKAKQVKLFAPRAKGDVSALVHAPVGYSEEELLLFLYNSGVDVSQFPEISPALLEHLNANNIDTSKITPNTNPRPKQRSLASLSEETIAGQVCLEKAQNGKFLRIVDVAILRLSRRDGRILVIEEDGIKRMPAAKRRPDENSFLAVSRLITHQLQLNENYANIDEKTMKVFNQATISPAYPMMDTLYRKRCIRADLQEISK